MAACINPRASALQLVPTESHQDLDTNVSLVMFPLTMALWGSDIPLQAVICQMGTLIVLPLRKLLGNWVW